MKYFIRPALALTVLAFLPALARADTITDFHSDITISRDNVVTVQETIVYNPQDESHHGIYRFVPAQFSDNAGQIYSTRISFLSVTGADGRPYHLANHYSNRQQLYLKIGDPNQYISNAPHTYKIAYQIAPLAVAETAQDRLIINITGQQWQTSLERTTATINFAPNTTITAATCYTGLSGSTASDCTAAAHNNQVDLATTRILGIGEGLTADIRLPAGSFASYLQPNRPLPFSDGEKLRLALAGLLTLLLLATMGWAALRWWADWQERRGQTIIPQYTAPDGLKPAQMSILDSPKSSVADVTATLVDLAVRGYLKIEQIQPQTWYRSADYRLTKLQAGMGLAPFEQELFGALFGAGPQLTLSDLRQSISPRRKLHQAIQAQRQQLGQDLNTKGYYASSPTSGLVFFKVLAWLIGTTGVVGATILTLNGNGATLWLVVSAIGTIVAAVLQFIRTDRTRLGNEEWAKVEGFKWFLRVTETDRLAFTDAPARTPELFNSLLPYAIALKVEKEWAQQFADIDVSSSVGGWYGGSVANSFNTASFASDLSSNFGSAVGSSFAGSSGGGGAGGGGGGGGGGGW